MTTEWDVHERTSTRRYNNRFQRSSVLLHDAGGQKEELTTGHNTMHKNITSNKPFSSTPTNFNPYFWDSQDRRHNLPWTLRGVVVHGNGHFVR